MVCNRSVTPPIQMTDIAILSRSDLGWTHILWAGEPGILLLARRLA